MSKRWLRTSVALGGGAALLVVAATAAFAATNQVKNGSFENPVGNVSYVSPSTIGPWHVTAGSVDVVNSACVGCGIAPAAGAQSLDLNGSDAGTISQTIKLPSGGNYLISFKLAGNPNCDLGPKQLAVKWNGTTVMTPTFNTTGHTPGSPGWVMNQITVTGAAGSATLAFSSLTPGTLCGPALDAISVKHL
jgi:Protein of unknown function (DUF642)